MNDGRNTNGRFTKGHPGFKPKGAVSRKKQKQDQLINQVLGYLDNNIEEALRALKPNQFVKFYLNLNKLRTPKLKRIPYEPPEESDETDEMEGTNPEAEKIEFEFVDDSDPEPLNPAHITPNP